MFSEVNKRIVAKKLIETFGWNTTIEECCPRINSWHSVLAPEEEYLAVHLGWVWFLIDLPIFEEFNLS